MDHTLDSDSATTLLLPPEDTYWFQDAQPDRSLCPMPRSCAAAPRSSASCTRAGSSPHSTDSDTSTRIRRRSRVRTATASRTTCKGWGTLNRGSVEPPRRCA
ncbi:hypothetical protein K466DRAFT_308006 [Polyporus arcularius HHB13444]|uniref:Uncharacterized protein n=1 Tax=Polyporus arcularius HHB13444 TaxID=1314778 RepID=A0A5C3NY12_9APHY|nr:hypothetical protein K466DRAFT_308006 [Polyporus arcularius HHB13444]